MYTGVVVRWNSRKGCGHISCPDFPDDLFVHVSAFGSGELIEGASVEFEVEDDINGKKKAIMVTGEGVDPTRRPPSHDGGRERDYGRREGRFGGGDRDNGYGRGGGGGGRGGTHTGTVARWNSTKGLGYISCRDFDQDVFVHVSSFGGGELIEGRNVTFEVEEEGNGKMRARDVRGPAVDPRRGDGGDRRSHPDQYQSRDSRDRRGGGGYPQERSFGGPRDRYNDRPVDRYNDRPVDRYNDRPVDRYNDRPVDRYNDRPMDRYNDRPVDRYNDRPMDRYNDRPVDRYNDRPSDRFNDRYNDRPMGRYNDRR